MMVRTMNTVLFKIILVIGIDKQAIYALRGLIFICSIVYGYIARTDVSYTFYIVFFLFFFIIFTLFFNTFTLFAIFTLNTFLLLLQCHYDTRNKAWEGMKDKL